MTTAMVESRSTNDDDPATRAVELVEKVIDPKLFTKTSGTYRLKFTDREGSDVVFHVADERLVVNDGSDRPAALTVSLGWEAFTRLTTGQLELHDLLRYGHFGGLQVAGDGEMLQPLVESLRAALPTSKVNLTKLEMDRLRRVTAPVRRPIEIERRDHVTKEEFMDRYAHPGRPVVLTRMMEDWPIFGISPEGLRDRIGDVRTSAYFYNDSTCYQPTVSEHIEALVRAAAEGTESELVYAAMELPVEVVRRLELSPPPFYDRKQYVLPRLWLGGRGATTPLHYDDIDNFLAQVFGEKIVTLYHPDECDLIDPDGKRLVYDFDPESTDRTRQPLARHANPIRVVLGPGEVLFNPGMWYHHVTVSKGPSFSVNFFVGRALPATLWRR